MTRKETESVNTVKLSITPRVMPKGRWCPFPAMDDESTIGKTGQIHGASIVTNPAKNENPSNKIICILVT